MTTSIRFIATLICVGTSFLFAAQIPNYVPSNGLVGWWPFNGNANDLSGNGNHGTVNGATLTNDRFGNTNMAYSFDGVNDYISLATINQLNLSSSPFTISIWVNSQVFGANNDEDYIIGTPMWGGGSDEGVKIQNNPNGSASGLYSSSLGIGGLIHCGSNNNFNLNQWYNVLIRYNNVNGSFEMFINGILLSSSTLIGSPLSNPYPVSVGAFVGPWISQYLTGKTDDIGIWNRALTQQEITNLYQGLAAPQANITTPNASICSGQSTTLSATVANPGTPCANTGLPPSLTNGLLGYWPFCGNANDASGNGNNGTVNGPTLTADRFGSANNAYSFDGMNDYIGIGNLNLGLSNQSFSVGLWFKTIMSPSGYGYMISDYSSINGGDNIFAFHLGHSFNNGVIYFDKQNMPSYFFQAQSNASYSQWNNLVIVSNALTGSIEYYINGTLIPQLLVNSSSINNQVTAPIYNANYNYSNGQFFRFGCDMFNSVLQEFYKGELDDIGIWSRALNQQEVTQLYQLGQPTYSWSNGATTPSITVSPAQSTTYTCTISMNGATTTQSQTITVNPLPIVNAGQDQTVFAGTQVTLSGSGATSYTWNNGVSNGVPFTANTTTTYTVTGNANGCTGTDQVLVTVLPAPTLSINTNDSICPGQTTTLTAAVANQGTPCTNSGLPGSLSNGLLEFYPFCGDANSGLNNGNNGVVNGANLTLDANGNNNSAYAFNGVNSSINLLSNFCGGQNLNQATFRVKFKINAPGSYGIWNKDGSWQEVSLYTTANGAVGLFWAFPNQYNAIESSQGIISPNTWYDVVIIFAGLNSKIYINGALLVGTTISVPSSSISFGSSGTCGAGINRFGYQKTSCSPQYFFNGSLDEFMIYNRALTQQEITQLYQLGQPTYSWSNGATTPSITVSPAQTTTYTCTISMNGATTTQSQTITVNPLPTVSAGANLSVCTGTSVTLSGSGASSYAWNNGVTNGVSFIPNATTTYTVTGTAANGCTNTAQTTVTVNALPTVTAPANQTVCSGTIVTLTGSGASTYAWNNGVSNGVAFPVNVTTTYTVTGTDANGCTNTAQTTLTVNALPTVTATSNQAVCAGTFVTISGSGALSYSWNNGVQNGVAFTPNATTTYTVTGTDANGCSNTAQTTVTVNSLPAVSGGTNQAICSGAAITLSGSGASSYTWNNNVQNGVSFTPNATQTYTVTGIDNNGCSNVATVTVTVNALPVVSANYPISVCQGTPVVLFASGALTYAWNNNVQNGIGFIPQSTQVYTVVGTDANGCTDSDQITVTVNSYPTVNAGSNQTVCAGTQVTLNASGALSYTWNNNVVNGVPFTINSTQTFTVIGSNYGCNDTAQVTVTVNALPAVSAGTNQSTCSGGSVTLTGSGALSYTWNNNVQNGVAFSPNATTTYTVTGTDANGCTNTAQTTVTVNALPTVNAGANQTVCAGTTATLNGSGAVSYAWDNNVQNGVSFTPNATQTYTVTGTDANGCQGTDQVLVTVASQTTSSITQAACLTYELNGQVYNQSGVYTQTLVNAQGCDSILTLNLTINGLPSIPVVNVGGDNLLSTPAVANTTYQWVFCPSGLSISNQNDTSYLPNVNGSYAVEASNACGTVVSECVTIDNIGIEELTNPLVIYPNPTPNVLYVQGISALETKYHLFDNQSQLIKEGKLTSIANAISLFELPSGLYHLYIENHIFKIIKH